MSEHALERGALHKPWPGFSLREKRIRLLEEKLRAAAIEARLLGFGRAEVTRMLLPPEEDES